MACLMDMGFKRSTVRNASDQGYVQYGRDADTDLHGYAITPLGQQRLALPDDSPYVAMAHQRKAANPKSAALDKTSEKMALSVMGFVSGKRVNVGPKTKFKFLPKCFDRDDFDAWRAFSSTSEAPATICEDCTQTFRVAAQRKGKCEPEVWARVFFGPKAK